MSPGQTRHLAAVETEAEKDEATFPEPTCPEPEFLPPSSACASGVRTARVPVGAIAASAHARSRQNGRPAAFVQNVPFEPLWVERSLCSVSETLSLGTLFLPVAVPCCLHVAFVRDGD